MVCALYLFHDAYGTFELDAMFAATREALSRLLDRQESAAD